MFESTGKNLRLSEFINPTDGKSLIVDTSIAGSNGYIGELIEAEKIIPKIAQNADGIILNCGQIEKISDKLPGKGGASLIMRLDWTNCFRDNSFPLPASEITRVIIAHPEDALHLGASAVVMYLLLGFDEDFESKNIADIANFARKCVNLSIPLIVDLHLNGPKINEKNWSNSVKLGVGMMVEAGVDGLIIPDTDQDTFNTLLKFSPIPLFLHSSIEELLNNQTNKHPWTEKLEKGFNGFCLGKELFENKSKYTVKELTKKSFELIHSIGITQKDEN